MRVREIGRRIWNGTLSDRTWLFVLVSLGLATRLVRWGVDFPFWGDEAYIALNLIKRNFVTILEPLQYNQIAPAGFLWGSLATGRVLGFSERAARLLPLLASLASVACFVVAARSVARMAWGPAAPARMAIVPIALFSIAYYPIRYAAELKPYAIDLCVAALVLALVAAPRGNDDAQRLRWTLRALALLALPALLFSYPAVFVIVGAALACLPEVLRDRSRGVWRAALGLAFTILLGFGVGYGIIGRAHRAGSSGGGRFLVEFWQNAFPPEKVADVPRWLLTVHTGPMFAYPNGGASGGSTATFLAAIVGLAVLASRAVRGPSPLVGSIGPASPRDPCLLRRVVAALVWPFVLTLGAAWLRLYPYGGHPRISLYFAPAICLTAGIGLAVVLGKLGEEGAARWSSRLLLLCLLVGLVGMARDVIQPYRVPQEEAGRRVVGEVLAGATRGEAILVLPSTDDLEGYIGPGVIFEWYVRRAGGDRVRFGGAAAAPVPDPDRELVVLDYRKGDRDGSAQRWRAWAEFAAGRWRELSREGHCYTPSCEEELTVARYAAGAPPSTTK